MEIIVGSFGIAQAGKDPDGPGAAPAGGGPAMAEPVFDHVERGLAIVGEEVRKAYLEK